MVDMQKIVGQLGDDVIGSCGEPLGLDKETSVRVARALAAHFNLGGEEAVKAAAADTGLSTDVVGSMSKKLMDEGKNYVMKESGVADAVDKAKADAMAAVQNQAKGMFGKLFGKA